MYYKSAEPDSKRDEYNPNENVNFTLNFDNQSLVRNSVKLCGKLEVVTKTGDPLAHNPNTMIDALTGIHGAIQSVTCQFFKFGVVENLDNYPRLVKMKMLTRQNDGQACSMSSNTTSLTLARDEQTNALLPGTLDEDGIYFACPIDCIVNRSLNDIPSSKVGNISINIRLASVNAFVINANGTGYSLSDLELIYNTVDEVRSKGPLVFESYSVVKHTLSSSRMSLSSQIPSQVMSVVASFIPIAKENVDASNNLECATLPNISRLNWTFNDSFNLVSYELLQREDILFNYVKALGNTGYNFIRSKKIAEDKGFGIGLLFPKPMDLSNRKISVNIDSDVSNADPYSMYMYVKSIKAF